MCSFKPIDINIVVCKYGTPYGCDPDGLLFHSHFVDDLSYKFVVNTVVLGFCCYIFMNSIHNLQLPSIYNQISIGLGISMAIPYLPITIGMGMLIILALEKYYTVFQTYKSGGYDRHPAKKEEGGADA